MGSRLVTKRFEVKDRRTPTYASFKFCLKQKDQLRNDNPFWLVVDIQFWVEMKTVA